MQIDPNSVQWDDAPTPVRAAPSFPGIIRGAPPASKVAAEARAQAGEYRAQEDQAMQREQLQLSKENAARNAKQDELGTESERTAGFLAGRISEAVKRLAPAAQKNPAAQAPTMGVEAVRGIAGDTAANYFTSAERQQIYAAQRDILDAALTLGTGAAYTKEQLKGYEASYLPQLFDDPETIASKRSALRTLLQQGSRKAGRSAPDIEAAIVALDQLPDIVANDEAPEGLTGSVTDDSDVVGSAPNGGTPPPNGGLDPNIYNPEGGQGIIDLAKHGITSGLLDESSGAGGYLGALITGNDPSKAYTRERDAARENIRRARIAHPVIGTLAEFMGGGAGVKAVRGAASLGTIVKQGASLGALGGFGYGEGDQSLTTAAGGAVLGGALGGAFGGVGKLIEGRAARSALAHEQVNVIEAGQRQGIPIRQPDVRPELRNKLAQVETTGAGGPIIQQTRAGDAAAIESRVSALGGQGSASDPYALGTKIQDAGRNYIARTKAQAGRMYDKARELSSNQSVQPTEAVAALDAQIADLRATGENANAEAIRYLDDVRADLAKEGGVTIDAIRNIRTNMRGQISQRGLTGTDTDRRVMAAIDGANLDMARDLPPEAAQAFKAADAFYKERQDFISKTLKSVMGDRNNPLPPETAAARLTSMTQGKGNFERFSSMWKELSPEDQADTAATIAETLGRKANGDFSVPALIKSLDPKKGINPRTARLIFGDDGAKALDDLRAIASAKDETQRAMNNSRTGTAVNAARDSFGTLMWGLFGFTQGGPVGAAGGAAARGFFSSLSEKRAARMLMNPDFTKLLRNAPNTNDPATINRYFSRVAGVLAANDNEALTNAIASAFRKSPGAAAANEETDSRGVPPQQNGM